MASGPFRKLFEPAQIGCLTLPNRLVMPPMATNYENEGFVTSRQKAYYEARARGGVGLIIVEAISIDSPGGNSRRGKIALDDDVYLPAMSAMTKTILKEHKVGQKVLIIGGGLVGCEAADYFSGKGRKVTVIELRDKMALELIPLLRRPLLDRLRKKGVIMLVGVKGEKIEGRRMIFQDAEGKQQWIEADTFILATGEIAGLEKWSSLKEIQKGQVYFVGDMTNSRGILEAVTQGHQVGSAI